MLLSPGLWQGALVAGKGGWGKTWAFPRVTQPRRPSVCPHRALHHALSQMENQTRGLCCLQLGILTQGKRSFHLSQKQLILGSPGGRLGLHPEVVPHSSNPGFGAKKHRAGRGLPRAEKLWTPTSCLLPAQRSWAKPSSFWASVSMGR